MNKALITVVSASLAGSLLAAPLAALAHDRADLGLRANADVKVEAAKAAIALKAQAKATSTATSTTAFKGEGKAYGHLFAPGWIKNHATTTVTATSSLPHGIWLKIKMGLDKLFEKRHNATTTKERDLTAPVISAVAATNIGSTSAQISWTTNEPATSKVYVASGSTLNRDTAATAANGSLVTSHSLTLSGLASSTTYSYAVQSKDKAGNVSTSGTLSFITGL